MTFRVKNVKAMYKFVGYEEEQLQEYDYGICSSEYCILWKDGKKINKKLIFELMKVQDEIEMKTKEKEKIESKKFGLTHKENQNE